VSDSDSREAIAIKILGQEYRVRSDAEAAHLEIVAEYVDGVLRKLRRTTPDTQDAAILAALNIASDLLMLRDQAGIPADRVQALIDLVESV
jgi:cell division protein ZapA (FtsZ GTPase activity inhibitor)